MTQTPQPAQAAQDHGPSEGHQQGQHQSSKFWDDILSTGIRRDRSRQWFGGVCSGIARKVDVDPVLIRAAVIALTLFGGFGVVVYLIAWLLMPDETGRIMARDALNRDGGDAGGAIALSVIALVVIAAVVFGDNGFLIGWGIVPLAVIGWLVWRHQQRKGASPSPWMSAPQGTSAMQGTSATPGTPAPPNVYAASSAPAYPAPSATAPYDSAAPASAPSSGPAAWQPPPAPPVPPRAHLPLAPPPPPRPRRRSAGFAGFALALGAGIVGYGAGLLLDDPLNFSGSRELLAGITALGAASLVTMIIGLTGRRSLMSALLVVILGLGTTAGAIGDDMWSNGQGTRTWTPGLSTTATRYELGAGETTLDLRPLVQQLASPVPAPSVATPTAPNAPVIPQQIEVSQGAGEMRIIVPEGANARIVAKSAFGEVQVRGDLPHAPSDRDRGDAVKFSETMTVNVGSTTPTIIVRADVRFGEITIQEG